MTGQRGATRTSIMPQPTRCRRATLPKRPLSRHETELIEVDRQLRNTARAVAIRPPTISYCESFAIAKALRFGRQSHLGAAHVQEAADSVAGRGRDHADHRHLQTADPPIADERK